MDIFEVLNDLTTNASLVSAALTAGVIFAVLGLHAFLVRRGKKQDMTRKERELKNRKVADGIGDTLLTMLARDILTPKEYHETHLLIAHALGISDMMPKTTQKDLKKRIKMARAARNNPGSPRYQEMKPVPDMGPTMEGPTVVNAMDRFNKKKAA